MQYEEQEELRALVEVISRLRIEHETHVLIAIGWKQHIEFSNGVHAIVAGKMFSPLRSRLRRRSDAPGDSRWGQYGSLG